MSIRSVAVFCLLPLCTSVARGDEAVDARKTLDEAVETFQAFASDPGMTGFRHRLAEARGILVLPKVVKAGFIIGGSGGRGVLIVRDEARSDWSPPVFYTMGSGSVGLQVGVQVAEIALLVMSQKGIDALMGAKVQFGGDVSVAAGPVGVGQQSASADVLGYSRSKGVYAGLSLDGAYIDPDDSRNAAYHGQSDISPSEIIVQRSIEDEDSLKLRGVVAIAAAR